MSRALVLITLAVLAAPGSGVSAQTPGASVLEPRDAPVAILPTALYNDQANVREATDSDQAQLGQTVLRDRLRATIGDQIRPYSLTDSLAYSDRFAALGGGAACAVRVACARAVAEQAGARWVVLSKVSKTSNLIWLLSAQLIHVPSGTIILDDSTELKGDPGPMVKVGMRQFADRVARTIRAGGVASNFPGGVPGNQ